LAHVVGVIVGVLGLVGLLLLEHPKGKASPNTITHKDSKPMPNDILKFEFNSVFPWRVMGRTSPHY
jgi:hypothetical protein